LAAVGGGKGLEPPGTTSPQNFRAGEKKKKLCFCGFRKKRLGAGWEKGGLENPPHTHIARTAGREKKEGGQSDLSTLPILGKEGDLAAARLEAESRVLVFS